MSLLTLTIDGYTGYNVVTDVDGRERTGCWSHSRRHLFDALATAPEARAGLDIILDLFMVERKAQRKNIVGTHAHLELRRLRSTPVLERLLLWREKNALLFEPKSPMGEALRYMKNQWPCSTPHQRIEECGSTPVGPQISRFQLRADRGRRDPAAYRQQSPHRDEGPRA